VVAVGAFAVTTSAVAWFLVKKTVGLRVSEEEEYTGLDVAEIGIEAYSPDSTASLSMGGGAEPAAAAAAAGAAVAPKTALEGG
jgi:hypothetical protein